MSRAEGANIEAPQAPRGWNLGRGVPSTIGQGSGEGAVPRIFFNFLPRNGAFSSILTRLGSSQGLLQ